MKISIVSTKYVAAEKNAQKVKDKERFNFPLLSNSE